MCKGIDELEKVTVAAAEHPHSLSADEVSAVERTVELLDRGKVRLAEKREGD